ncbi:hypothetical protein DPMN_065121 [Dreissena polymorpha]|uniref:Uncharacterized protein n=1 Tax=Dreissena polymorpha TaxID=45954 RepID=A0A9D4CDH8_DREPO|nr:hypothetical protein DPMN_065121 [Dreissena polymorpha]
MLTMATRDRVESRKRRQKMKVVTMLNTDKKVEKIGDNTGNNTIVAPEQPAQSRRDSWSHHHHHYIYQYQNQQQYQHQWHNSLPKARFNLGQQLERARRDRGESRSQKYLHRGQILRVSLLIQLNAADLSPAVYRRELADPDLPEVPSVEGRG